MKTKWFLLGCLTSLILALGAIFLSFFGLMKLSTKYASQQVAKTTPGTVLHLELSGEIFEYNDFYNDFFSDRGTGAHEIIQKIDQAATDDNIDAILLEPTWISCGYAVLNELKTALDRFKSHGKKVYAYMDRAGNKDYLLALSADEIFLNPSASGGIMITGLGSNVLFYKELFDKIGVDITVIHAGEYKGAGENYSRTGFSPPVKENLNNLFSDIYEKILADLAAARNIDESEARYIYEERPEIFISSTKALDYSLVDALVFREDIPFNLGTTEKSIIPFSKYSLKQKMNFANPQVAVVYLQGEIVEFDSGINTQIINFKKLDTIIELLEENPRIGAVVLRINSPGGSALESEIMYDRISKLREKMPVVISMSNVAASGGYYISASGNYVFADPFTITGSIGVVTMIPNFKQMADKVGITTDPIKKGKYVDIFNPFVEPDIASLQALKLNSDNIYKEFKTRVSEGRNIEMSDLEKIAGGRIWSSDDALVHGLIDEIGLLDDAVQKAADLAGLEQFFTGYYPAKKYFLEEVFKRRFDIDVASTLWNNDLYKDSGYEKLVRKYHSLRQDPIQAIMPLEIE